MTDRPPPAPEGADGQGADERLRENGVLLVTRIAACIRVGRSYSVGNQVFVRQVESLLEVAQPVIAECGEVVLVALDRDLFLNGSRIPVNHASIKFHESVIDLFAKLAIAGLRLEPGLSAGSITSWFQLVLEPESPQGRDLLSACYVESMQGIAPVVSAATDPGQVAGGHAVTSGASFGASSEGAAATGGAGGAGSALEVVAQRRFAQSLNGARALLMPTSLQEHLQLRHAKRVVQPLVEGASLNQPVVVGLSTLSHRDANTYTHAVNVCAIAVTMGHVLELGRRALADLGVAALLHDVGKQEVAGHIEHDLEAFTPEERTWAEKHTVEGAKLLARSTTLSPTSLFCMRVALEHHAVGAEGYPRFPTGWVPSLLSRIVGAADCFVSLLSRHSRVARMVTPTQALGMMLGPLSNLFEPALLWALARSVGFYPAGQIVELDDGSVARVLAPNAHDPARPHVHIIVAADGTGIMDKSGHELRPIPPHRSVRRALTLQEYPAGHDISKDSAAA
jgi:putative nucleotidyltransferase with HDIG domain